jgi:alpha-1,2-mannosyltransferase
MHTRDSSGKRRTRRGRDLRFHAALLASAMWLIVGADILSPGPLGRQSKLHKGNDFVQFYVMASLARDGNFHALVDERQFHDAQAGYAISGNLLYPPVYGPQVALMLAPLAWFKYQHAYALFTVVSFALIAWATWIFWRQSAALAGWGATVAVATAAFPPIGFLILNGQLSGVAVAALGLCVVGLGRRSPILAGAAIGLLAYKPSLFLPGLAICALAGEWTIAAAAVAIGALQLCAASPIVGVDVVRDYLGNSATLATIPDVLARKPHMMGSLRTFWAALLPGLPARVAYVLTAAGAIGISAWAWRRTSDPVQRAALLSIGIALAAPHFYLYDMVLVIPAFVASAAILLTHSARGLRWCTYAAFLSPLLVPLAARMTIQPVTLALAAWLLTLAHTVSSASELEDPALSIKD